MPLHIRGPRADPFVRLLGRHAGFDLVREPDTDRITIHRDGLINPFVAPSLQELVGRMITQVEAVTITARGDMPGGIVDSFRGVAGAQIARRSVFLPDLLTIERLDPQFCAAMIAHFLAEYDHSAVRRAPNQFADAHVAGLRAEAEVIHELTGRPVFRGASRPWERATTLGNGRIRAERRYGPGNVYILLLGPLPTAHIISVTRS